MQLQMQQMRLCDFKCNNKNDGNVIEIYDYQIQYINWLQQPSLT